MNTISAILFDMDLTLTNSFESFTSFLNTIALEHYNTSFPKSRFKELWGKPHQEYIEELFNGLDTFENIKKYMNEKLAKEPLIQPALPGAIQAVESLYQRYPLGILTASTRVDVNDRLTNAGFNIEHFEYIQCFEDSEYNKPDPRVFDSTDKWLKTKQITRDNLLYIGDSILDYQSANGASVQFIGVSTGFHSREQFINEGLDPQYIIESLTEVGERIPPLHSPSNL